MELSEEAINAIIQAGEYAKEKSYEYVTPEILLLMILKNEKFSAAFESCGGDISALEKELSEYAESYVDKAPDKEPELSEGVKELFDIAGRSAYNSGSDKIYIRHLVHALWNLENSYAVYFMEKQDVTEAELLQEIACLEEDEAIFENEEIFLGEHSEEQSKSCEIYAPCLNETLADVNPLIGREAELDRTIQILCRKDKNNPLHIGEPGVGKTAVTLGLVQLIRENKVPKPLLGAKVFALDLGGMLAGTQYRGDFEKRFKKVLAEIGREEKPIIYIDEIHNLAGAGAVGESSFDASNMLKPYLSDGHIRFIGATTFEEYKKYFEKNKSLVRRFQNVEIKEPDEAEAIKILEGLKPKYEKYHGVKFSKGVIEYAVKMSEKYIHERFLPDKAIDLIDEAGAYRKLHPTDKKTQTVDRAVINEVLTTICRVPVESVRTDDISGLADLEKRLKSRIFGQDEAISQAVNAVKFSKAGLLEENKPQASLLFVGPTGVGKTEIARSLAEELGIKLIRFDMSEYGEKHAIAKLIGSPAGYVGYEEGGLLTEAIRKTPSAVLLLDEIEKAHPDIYNILLQVMDYATLTDNQGRKADFRNVILIMTSNAGANRLGKSSIGFESTNQDNSAVMEAVKKTFRPEFRNRLNKIVVFSSMDDEMAERIIEKKLRELSAQLLVRNIEFSAEQSARELIKKKGVSHEFGARELDRVIRNDIKPLFVDEILFGRLKNGGSLMLSAKDDKFFISTSKKKK
ncbi:MAG: AAA family ATPase [Oscillospiraceae bacterium]|nr:AAA family ATPase [Oscillospiraceae bacterium]